MDARSREFHNERALATYPASCGGKYKNNSVYFGLSISQIILGSLMFIFGIVSIFTQAGMYYVGHGIWCGIMAIVAGSISAGAFRNQSSCLTKASLVLNIISSIFAGTAFILSMVGAGTQSRYPYGNYSYHTAQAINIVMIAICALATVTSILLSVGSCKSVRCCCSGCCCEETTQVDRAIASRILHSSIQPGLNRSLPTLEPTVAYIYCDGVMTPIDVFTPAGQATRTTQPNHIADVHKLGLGNEGYLSDRGDHAPPGYPDL